MNTINQIYEFTQNIKKSDFICTLIPVNSVDEVNEHLKTLRKKLGKKGQHIQTVRGLGYKFEL